MQPSHCLYFLYLKKKKKIRYKGTFFLHILQDFVRLPLQNQNSQAAQSTGSSVTASGTGLSNQFGLSSGQLNSGYTSGLVTGLEGVSRSLDDVVDPTTVPQLRFCRLANVLYCFNYKHI